MKGKPGLSASTQAKSKREDSVFLVTSTLDLSQKSRQRAEPTSWEVLRRLTHKLRSQAGHLVCLLPSLGTTDLCRRWRNSQGPSKGGRQGMRRQQSQPLGAAKWDFYWNGKRTMGFQQIANTAWGTLESSSLGITAGVAGSMVWSQAHGSDTECFTPTPKASDTLRGAAPPFWSGGIKWNSV